MCRIKANEAVTLARGRACCARCARLSRHQKHQDQQQRRCEDHPDQQLAGGQRPVVVDHHGLAYRHSIILMMACHVWGESSISSCASLEAVANSRAMGSANSPKRSIRSSAMRSISLKVHNGIGYGFVLKV